MEVLFLMAGAVAVIVLASIAQTRNSLSVIAKKVPATKVLPKAVSVLILTAHASELIKVIEHASIVNVAAALLLLAVLAAVRSGTEDGLH